MKICLIHPPVIISKHEDFEYEESWHTLPHLGLGYIASMLKSNGFDVNIIECLGQGIELQQLYSIISDNKYDMVGITSYYYNTFYLHRIITRLRKTLPDLFIFLGGYLPTFSYKQVLNALPINCCVIGEGELTTLELARALQEEADWRRVSGIAYKLDGEIVKTDDRPLIRDLDILPFPERVFYAKKKFATLLTSRGCYGDCIFCAIRGFYEKCPGSLLRSRSPENVVEEIEYLVNKQSINLISILDDNFCLRSKKRSEWIDRFYHLLKEKNICVPFRIVTRTDEFIHGRDSLLKLKEVGLQTVFLGIESFVQRQLNFYNKMITAKQNILALELGRELDIKLDIGWIMFEPYVTIDELLYNMKLLRDLKFYDVTFDNHTPMSIKFPLMPFVNTKLFDYMNEMGIYDETKAVPYQFNDSDVDFCYTIINKIWIKKVFPVYIKYYLIQKATERGQVELAKVLREEKKELLKLDLDFMEKLCMGRRSKDITSENYMEFISQWDTALQNIMDIFLGAQKTLDS